MSSETENGTRLYKLRVFDMHDTAYVIVGSKGDVGHAQDWLMSDVGSSWLRLTGFKDEAGRSPITVVIAREQIAGMILERV